MTTTAVFGLIGILLIIGFLADYLFRKTNFPDILILLTLGYLLGPVFKIIDPSQLAPASQMIASLALVVILFYSGLEFEFSRVLSSTPRAILLVLLGVGISIASIAASAYYLFQWQLLDSLLLGTIVGGTSSAIVIPLITRARVPEQVTSLLSMESVLNSPVIIVMALVILEVICSGKAGVEASVVAQAIGIQFALGLASGIVVGFFWLWMLTLLENESYSDILTLAVVLLFYFLVETIDGSGVIFALVFGLILGNGVSVARFLRIKRTVETTAIMKRFHSQIYFFIKTFFFIYLGLMITFSKPSLVIIGVILAIILLCTRYIAVLLSSIGSRTLLTNMGILTTMLARGEAAAVLVQIVVAANIHNAAVYPDLIMAIIVTTVITSALGIIIFGGKSPKLDTGYNNVTT
ncbi:MAG: cation:proton antiporter [Dehalococcoidia bacterium]|nr:cation:proton antiporter [Dehalococcoidia bacterium]